MELTTKKTALLLAMACGITSTAQAYIPVSLLGATQFEGWEELTNANYPQTPNFGGPFPGAQPWLATIAPNVSGSSGNAEFGKVSGNGFTASASVYTPFTGATFTIESTAVVPGLENVVFQIDLGPGDAFYNAVPTLSFNSGGQDLAATFTGQTTGENPFANPVNPSQQGTTTNFIYQWDLSSVGSAITDYTIEWTTGSHAQIYGMQLDTSDTFSGNAVPEPATYAIFAGIAALAAALVRRRLRARAANA